MKKFKKILAAAAAAAIALTATGVAASAYSEPGPDAMFYYYFRIAEMQNLSDRYRYASARVEIINSDTYEQVAVKTTPGMIGKYEKVPASIPQVYMPPAYQSICSGTIHSAGSEYSPTEWSPREIL